MWYSRVILILFSWSRGQINKMAGYIVLSMYVLGLGMYVCTQRPIGFAWIFSLSTVIIRFTVHPTSLSLYQRCTIKSSSTMWKWPNTGCCCCYCPFFSYFFPSSRHCVGSEELVSSFGISPSIQWCVLLGSTRWKWWRRRCCCWRWDHSRKS